MRPVQDLDVLSDQDLRSNRSLFAAASVGAAIVVADQLTKAWAERRLTAGPCRLDGDECIDLVFGIRFHLVYNPGAAFSTGTGLGPLFGVIALIMSIVLLVAASRRRDRFTPLLLGLIAGGAIGNLVDRIFRAEGGLLSGEVIDFIDFQWWPVFNVADSAVVVGVIVFIGYSMFDSEEAQSHD